MSRNEEGEFELVLGNRQLVSVFLIVVILLGAFFSMGYLVGRSTSSGTAAENTTKPIVVESAKQPTSTPPVESANPQVVPTPVPAAHETAPPVAETSKPSPLQTEEEKKREAKQEEARKAEAKREEAQKKEEAKKELAKKQESKKEEPKKEEAKKDRKPGPAPASDEPRGGTFLQVVATSRADSEIVAESLAKKGFKTVIAPGPNNDVYRVLVGPVGDAADLAETRVRLETAGFKPYVRKY